MCWCRVVSARGAGRSQAAKLKGRSNGGSLYLIEEPTTGLHLEDVARLIDVLHRLVDDGHTVIVIEHNLDVIKHADWIIDLGPEGGNKGGKVIFEGTPKELLKAKGSLTGEFVRKSL